MKQKFYGTELSRRYATTFEELSKDGALSPIVGLDMVSSEQVAAYLGVTQKELLKVRTKRKDDLDMLGVVSMNGRAVASRVPGIERMDDSTYKAKLHNGQSITIPAPPRVYYTAAGVARIKEEMSTARTLVPTVSAESNMASNVSSGVQVFNNPEFGQIRTVEIDGEPWLVGKDVAQALGYSNTKDALARHVDDEDKRQEDGVVIRDPIGREQHPTIINESGLYSLVLSSKLPGAKKFKRWITSEVLPSIRKHGVYAVDELLNNPDLAIKALTALKEERAKNQALSAKIEADRPKVEFADHISGYKGTISMGDFAKLLSKNGVTVGRNKLYKWLRSEKILNQNNIPYQQYMDNGYFTVIETMKRGYPYQVTRVTGAGQVFLQKRFAVAWQYS